MANSANTTNLSRRLMLLRTGGALAATACLPAVALASVNVDASLIDACRKALDANEQYNTAVLLDEDCPDLQAYSSAEMDGIELAITTPAKGLPGLKAKAALLRMQLP